MKYLLHNLSPYIAVNLFLLSCMMMITLTSSRLCYSCSSLTRNMTCPEQALVVNVSNDYHCMTWSLDSNGSIFRQTFMWDTDCLQPQIEKWTLFIKHNWNITGVIECCTEDYCNAPKNDTAENETPTASRIPKNSVISLQTNTVKYCSKAFFSNGTETLLPSHFIALNKDIRDERSEATEVTTVPSYTSEQPISSNILSSSNKPENSNQPQSSAVLQQKQPNILPSPPVNGENKMVNLNKKVQVIQPKNILPMTLNMTTHSETVKMPINNTKDMEKIKIHYLNVTFSTNMTNKITRKKRSININLNRNGNILSFINTTRNAMLLNRPQAKSFTINPVGQMPVNKNILVTVSYPSVPINPTKPMVPMLITPLPIINTTKASYSTMPLNPTKPGLPILPTPLPPIITTKASYLTMPLNPTKPKVPMLPTPLPLANTTTANPNQIMALQIEQIFKTSTVNVETTTPVPISSTVDPRSSSRILVFYIKFSSNDNKKQTLTIRLLNGNLDPRRMYTIKLEKAGKDGRVKLQVSTLEDTGAGKASSTIFYREVLNPSKICDFTGYWIRIDKPSVEFGMTGPNGEVVGKPAVRWSDKSKFVDVEYIGFMGGGEGGEGVYIEYACNYTSVDT